MGRHVQQVQQLLAGSRNPNVEVPVQNPEVQVQVLRDYFPMSAPQRPHSEGVARARNIPAMQLAVEAQPALQEMNEAVIPAVVEDQPPARRSSRANRGRPSARLGE